VYGVQGVYGEKTHRATTAGRSGPGRQFEDILMNDDIVLIVVFVVVVSSRDVRDTEVIN